MYRRIILLIVGLIFEVFPLEALNPEETMFISTRCMEDNLPDDKSRSTLLSNWRTWTFEPADREETQCYVKCLLEKLSLYDPESKKFNTDVINEQSNEYPAFGARKNVKAYEKAVQSLPETENSCADVFKAYNNVHDKYRETSKKIFHGDLDLSKRVYNQMKGNIRPMGQSYFEYCENKNYPVGSPSRRQLCQIRKYEVLDDEQFEKHIDCIFRGLRYITKDNQLDIAEIQRDFAEAQKDTSEVKSVLEECQSQEPAANDEKAFHYYLCLVDSDIADDFKDAFDYREVRTQNYGYHLTQRRKYSKKAISTAVMKVDGKQCPSE